MAAINTNTIAFDAPELESPWPGAAAPTHQYFQRVWDAGTAGYCYYLKTIIDPAPLAAETTPNYTGAISAHSIIDVR